MKDFKTYLSESQRTYDFKIKIAGELTKEHLEKMKTSLEAYKVSSMSQPKRLPIQESPEFPNMGPVEINLLDVKLSYPVTNEQVHTTLRNCGCHPATAIKVIPADSPYNAIMDGKEVSNVDGKEGEAVLLQTEMKAVAHDFDYTGEKTIPNLIKELQAARSYEYSTVAKEKSSN